MDNNINQTLEKWYKTKETISDLEKKLKKYKDRIEKHMTDNKINLIEGDNYNVKRIKQSRSYITKKEISQDIWDKYSKSTEFYTYNISKK